MNKKIIIRVLIIIILGLALFSNSKIISAQIDDLAESGIDATGLREIKNNFDSNNPIAQVGDTVTLSLSNLSAYDTVWCVEKGQNLSSGTYKIDSIVEIGNYISGANITSNKFTTAVAHRRNGSNREITPVSPFSDANSTDNHSQQMRNARLAYIIEAVNHYTYNDYSTYPPQVALWDYFDNWRNGNAFYTKNGDGDNRNLLAPNWWYNYNEPSVTHSVDVLLDNSTAYARFLTNTNHGYNVNGKISATVNSGSVTEKNGKYYAGPYKVKYSFYDGSTNTDDALSTLKPIGLLKNVKINGSERSITTQVGGSPVDISTLIPNNGIAEFYIILNDNDINSNSGTLTATVEQNEYFLISARIWFMRNTTGSMQHLLITDAKRDTINGTSLQANLTINLPSDVSLQKYIIGANLDTNIENIDGANTRKNKYATTSSDDFYTEGVYNHLAQGSVDTNISKNNNVSKTNISGYNSSIKMEDPVEIEAGDSVTYKIIVYNNKPFPVNVKVRDDFTGSGAQITEIKTMVCDEGTEKYQNANKFSSIADGSTIDGVTLGTDEGKYRTFEFGLDGNKTRYFYVTIKYTKYIPYNNETKEGLLRNRAWIVTTTPQNTSEYRTVDADYIKMKPYKVSLEKYINFEEEKYDFDGNGYLNEADAVCMHNYFANMSIDEETKQKILEYGDINNDGSIDITDATRLSRLIVRAGKAEYLTYDANKDMYVDNTANDTKWTWHNKEKFNNVVTVSKDDIVSYTIRVNNDGDTNVYIPSITDILPNSGVDYKTFKVVSAAKYNKSNQKYSNIINAEVDSTASKDNTKIIKLPTTSTDYMLIPGDYILINVSVKVTASNMSLETYKNTALITDNQVINKNIITVTDTSPYNNEDSDYFKLDYKLDSPFISGIVWNDIAMNKTSDYYNSLYDNDNERKLSGIKVYLYKYNNNSNDTLLAITETDDNGEYSFKNKDSVGGAIKASLIEISNRWNTYNSLYVVFEYDGITYTSTPDGQSSVSITDSNAYNSGNYKINSNAKESDSKVKETRTSFNSKFETINKDSNIEYDRYVGKTSIEGQEYNIIPQSIHKYDVSKMAMQSATEVITLADNDTLMEEVKYINVGLRGRDTLDLNVKTDIDKISLEVNGVTTDYTGKNSVTVRKSDLSMVEDAANFASSAITSGNTDETQDIRQTDLVKAENSNYSNDQLLQSIKVTYKITVANESNTGISEVSIIDYYDSRYDFEEIRLEKGMSGKVENGGSSSEYNSKIITTDGNGIIYITYKLKESAINTLKGLNITEKLPTFNMAEIYEYKSTVGNNQTEYTRGLIDIDSAPESAASEKVILSDDYDGVKVGEKKPINESEIASRPTTLAYYFNKTDLQKIMYEDDTSVKAVIFNVTDDSRTIKGTVFRDNTTLNTDKIKTGNGKFDNDEDIVAGATVELVEYNENRTPEEVANNEGKVIFATTTDMNGEYIFYGYIPGNYIIRYSYGNNDYTVLKNRFSATLNKYSYNGEDYQSTNNTGSYGAAKLEHNNNFWYITNEQNGISVATDNKERRARVSANVTNSDSLMTLLNNARDGKELSDAEVTTIKNDTSMYATTYMMELKGEKVEENGNVPNIYGNYDVENMNFGIAEVPVTTIDLQTSVKQFTIKDAAGDNTIAEVVKQDDGEWEVKTGNVLAPKDTQKIDVSVEEQKLQGAKLQVTYDVTTNKNIEKNFDGNSYVNPVITGLVDFVDNNLSYNASLGENNNLWETTTLSEIRTEFAKSQYKDGVVPKGTVVNNDTDYTTILKAKGTNPLLSGTENVNCDLVLEKTLSSNDATVEDIISSSIEAYDYQNKVEILGINYANNVSNDGSITFRDRVRTVDRHIILAGSQYDYNESEIITIHPPTGNDNNIIYYVIGVVALGVLASGIVLIKKFAINKD